MRKNLSNEQICIYFNVLEATMVKNRNKLGIDYAWLYNKFIKAKTLRKRKDILYSLKNKFDEDLLDNIWEAYIEKYEYDEHIKRVKLNKKTNK